ncbi:MAG TPA: hypothetical protein VN042_07875, partial [Asticcacaulis sp.]|nr:hypothetical protein [Asticcacaulis sp.]
MHIHLRAFKTRTSALALLTTLLGASMAFSASAQSQSATYAIELPAETLAQALTDLSRQTHCQILFPYEVAAHLRAPAVVGTMRRDEALARLLVGSGLAIAQETDTTVSLKADAPSGTSEAPTEVIVTGTHIRGGNPTAPVHTVTRADIQASGYAEVGDVLRALPENFSGGQNPGVFGASGTNTANTNISSASTLNLRGLGT